MVMKMSKTFHAKLLTAGVSIIHFNKFSGELNHAYGIWGVVSLPIKYSALPLAKAHTDSYQM